MSARRPPSPGDPPLPLYRLYALAVWSLLCVILGGGNVASNDLWGRLSMPAVWLATGRFPYHDYFSYTTSGQAWTDHEWFSGFVFHGGLIIGGEEGLSLIKGLAVATMVGATFWVNRLGGIPPWWPAAILLAGFPVLELGFLTTGRPQIFTFALFPVVIGLLESARQHRRWARLGWLAPIGLAWSNLHGGFVAGLGLTVLYAIGALFSAGRFAPRRSLPYLVAAAVFLLPSLVNPYGWRYWPYMWVTLSHSRAMIDEWQGVPGWSLDYLGSKVLALATLSAVIPAAWGILVRAVRPERARPAQPSPDATPVVVLLVLLYLGSAHVKHQPLFVLGAAIYLPLLAAGSVSRWWARQALGTRLGRVLSPTLGQALACGLPLGLILAALFHLTLLVARVNPLHVRVHSESETSALRLPAYPVEAVRFLERSAYRGRLFTPFNWGQFVYWKLYPRFVVSLDGRFDSVYDVAMAEWLNSFYTTDGLDWEVPRQSRAEFILFDKEYDRALRGPGSRVEIPAPWVVVYDNAKFMVLGAPEAIARAAGSRSSGGALGSSDDDRSVSAFWRPASDRARFSVYGAPVRGDRPSF
jgi:hypothetical protein